MNSKLLETGSYQSGFKKGSMTQVNLTKCLQTILDTRKKRSARKAYIFVDLKKAYDSVRRDLLFKIMMERCQNDEERNLVLILSRLFLNTRF